MGSTPARFRVGALVAILAAAAMVLGGSADAAPLIIDYSFLDYPGADLTQPEGINDAGNVSGYAIVGGFTSAVGFVWHPLSNAFDTIDLGVDGITFAYKLNNAGVVVGDYVVPAQFAPPDDQGFVDDGGTVTTYPQYLVRGVNDSGGLTGFAQTAADGTIASFVAQGGAFTPFSCFGADLTLAEDINNSGVVVGITAPLDFSSGQAFRYSNGQCTDISVPGALYTDAWGLNDRGDVVGDYTDVNAQVSGAFLLHDGTYYTTAYPFDYTGSAFFAIFDINDEGVFVGRLYDAASREHAFVGTVPEPATSALPGIGIVAAGFSRRRRIRAGLHERGCQSSGSRASLRDRIASRIEWPIAPPHTPID